jgi:hypothetical protein
MARAARAQLADMRAMEEQTFRQQMHGGQFYGAGMVGAGATPSMGLSQFRGGGGKCPDCRRKRCVCDDSSSDEDMEGGAGLSGILGSIGDAAAAAVRGLRNIRGVRTPVVPRPTSNALVPYNPGQAAFTSNSAFRNYALNRIFNRPSTALATRTPGVMKPYSPEEAAARIRAAQAAGETNESVAARLARMGITPARVKAALALGIPAIALAIYFAEIDGDGGDAGYYDPGTGGPGGPGGPGPGGPGPGGPGGPGGTGGPRGPRGRRATGEGVATGNLADQYYAAQMMGAGRPRRTNARAEIVRKVMREQGLSLPAASKYVKENGLY